jgi:hypothetical protein
MKIAIHDNNTNETGTYKIYFTHLGLRRSAILSESMTNALLSMGQKEDFFIGKYKFIIKSQSDINALLAASK